ncbi:hypothetical protein [Halalkalibacter urbisdiaboli]|uniref:hypothetical protein n=1 Tax=Halalkalibacter urbisdiaboli TaxID=1960589 RepID=UPI000B4327B6|nr:hypothetical protein [Halalkalibacter urbisdiaboli]
MKIKKPTSVKEWSFTILIAGITGFSLYSAIFNEVIFRLLMILFWAGFAFYVIKKLNELQRVEKVEDFEAPPEESPTTYLPSSIKEKEIELKKVDFDRTQLLEELFTKAELNEAEKQQYRSKIKQKDNEMSGILLDLSHAKNVIQQAFLDTKKIFVKENPMREVAAALNSDVLNEDIYDLNKELHRIQSQLNDETIHLLENNSYIDDQFNLTRLGYKALMKEINKDIS